MGRRLGPGFGVDLIVGRTVLLNSILNIHHNFELSNLLTKLIYKGAFRYLIIFRVLYDMTLTIKFYLVKLKDC